ncbi:mRNA interferase MazF [Marinobacter daqiaonensis]|uniref:mRNA interferase MazF n=1 Tax=Marinobacter daqiaonensis TaxID=650891 RepID=A0A1I6JEF3_9GAMM|nr:type II toxin-antitoxin system PemK/MazF family toxin [Marinobacter daqiaonensis]SFR77327.1 mRNA interferase MazF [Marinobacter daqiaonensis]
MGAFAKGSVVLIRFPFSDLTQQKLRPAIVLAAAGQDDYILCQVTSKAYDPLSIELKEDQFASGSLHRISYARPGKLFTAHQSILLKEIARLKSGDFRHVLEEVILLLRADSSAG